MLKKSIISIIAVGVLAVSNTVYAKNIENEVVITKDNFIHADSVRAYLKELAKTDNKVNVITV